jgi:hypothetical protein
VLGRVRRIAERGLFQFVSTRTLFPETNTYVANCTGYAGFVEEIILQMLADSD